MDFQKIILAGEIVNEPEFEKTKEGVIGLIKFEMAVKHFTEERIIFSVVVTTVLEDVDHKGVAKGREVIVEGIINIDQVGEWIVEADWFECGGYRQESVKGSKLLF